MQTQFVKLRLPNSLDLWASRVFHDMMHSKALYAIFCLMLLTAPAQSQQTVAETSKDWPAAELRLDPIMVLDTVVTEQWPSTLPAVNAPTDTRLLNPGQCIRLGIIASGKGHEHFLDGASISFMVNVKGADEVFPLAPLAATKLIKPAGGDFVTGALATAAIKNPHETMSALAASAGKWCVPPDAPDEIAEVHATVKLGSKETKLNAVKVQIESLATAASKTFADVKEFSEWSQAYHTAPEPGRLTAAISFFGANISSESLQKNQLILLEFLKVAFQHDSVTVREFGPLVPSDKVARRLTLTLLSQTGITLTHPPQLTDDDRTFVAKAGTLPDPYDMRPNQQLFSKLDMLWADFSASGRLAPVAAIVSALAWRADYDAFDEMRKKGIRPTSLTDSIIRGVTYTAAGWSLSSFQRSDPLATDYIAWIEAQPDTPDTIKKELSGLGTNPAFKHQ